MGVKSKKIQGLPRSFGKSMACTGSGNSHVSTNGTPEADVLLDVFRDLVSRSFEFAFLSR